MSGGLHARLCHAFIVVGYLHSILSQFNVVSCNWTCAISSAFLRSSDSGLDEWSSSSNHQFGPHYIMAACVSVRSTRHMSDSLMCLLDALGPSSYACHTGLTTGGGGVLPRSRYTARPGQSAYTALGRRRPSLQGSSPAK